MSRYTARARSGQDRTSLYAEITDKIIAELEAGRVPWVQPWGTAAAKAPLAMPKNATTQRRYSGVNVLILWGAVIERGFVGQSWLTFRQALSLGGNVRKGEHGTTVVYADRFTPEDERRRAERDGDEPGAIPFLKRFTVFNTDQCENLPDGLVTAPPPVPEGLILPQAEALDRRNRRRFPHRRRPRFLQPGARLRPSAAARRLFRADQLAPDGPARARSLGRPSLAPGPRSIGRLRLRPLCQGRAGRRNDQRLRVRLARHRADRAPRRLSRLLAGSAARGRPRHRPRRQRRVEGGRLSAGVPARPDEPVEANAMTDEREAA